MRRVVWLALLFSCATPLHKELRNLTEDGHFVEASRLAARTLEEDPDDTYAEKILLQTVPNGWKALVEEAREQEASGENEAALATYKEADAYGIAMVEAGAPDPADEDLSGEIDDLTRKLAAAYFGEGEGFLAANDYAAAVAAYEKCRAFVPDYKDVVPHEAAAMRLWAESDLKAGRWREAITHFDKHVELGGDVESRAWSASIHAALGRSFLERGSCRQAVAELRAAEALPYDPTLGKDLARAKECARVEVMVVGFDQDVASALTDVAIASVLEDEVSQALRAKGSEYVVLLDPESIAVSSKPGPLPRYEVKGRLTQLRFSRPAPTVTPRNASGAEAVPCLPDGEVDSGGELELCVDPVLLTYEEHNDWLDAEATLALKVVDAATGAQVATQTFDEKVQQGRVWGANFAAQRESGSVPVQVAATPGKGVVGVGEAIVALTNAPPPFPAEAEVAQVLMTKLCESVATAVIAAVDAPPTLPDPVHIEVRKPVMDPEGVTFGEP